MGGAFLRSAAAIWLLSRIRFDLLRKMRRRHVERLAQQYAKQGGTTSILTGPGVIRVHEAVELFDNIAACGLIIQHATGGTSGEITCRACKNVHQRAVHAAMSIDPATS